MKKKSFIGAILLPILLWLHFFSNVGFCQKIKIVEVLDTNLFLLQDGRKISLANLQTPSQHDSSKTLKNIARDLLTYERKYLLNRTLWMESSPAVRSDTIPLPVHLFQKFLLNRINFNAHLLELGYARYAPVDSLYREQYLKAVLRAQKRQRGIWSKEHYEQLKVLDVVVGVAGGLGESFGKAYDKHNNLLTYEARVMLFHPSSRNKIELKVGEWSNREEGYGVCEYGPAVHFQATARTRYVIFNCDIHYEYFGFGVGYFFTSRLQKGFCGSEAPDFRMPNLSLRIGPQKKFYLSAELFNDIFNFVKIAGNYHFNGPYSVLWLGYSAGNVGSDNDEAISLLGLGFQHLFKKRIIITAEGYFAPFTRNKFFRLGVALRLPSDKF
ncbi:thermonuclease family protein [Calditrichota bacterium LG25]